MHHFVFGTGQEHAGRMRVGAFLHAHEHRHFGAERLLVELDGLLATAVKEQVRLNSHWLSFSDVGGLCGDSSVRRHDYLSNEGRRNRQARSFFLGALRSQATNRSNPSACPMAAAE
jgi:hypothetical protein